jgi:hypothetical protein
MKRFAAIILILSGVIAQAQQTVCINEDACDSLAHEIHFIYKQRTQKFSNALNCAALRYPELRNFTIEIKRKKITTMMAARPKRDFLFHSKTNRTYVILITDKLNMNAEHMYNEMSPCAISGVFGHELSHIITYSQKSNFRLMGFGIQYLFNKKSIETETDLLAVKHGFGDGLIEFNRYIFHSPWVNKKYLKRKSKYYLSAAELNNSLEDAL